MQKLLPLYIIAGLIGAIALISGLTGKKLLFVTDTRSAVIVLAAAGFLMCSFGALGVFITKAPLHPLTIAGYVLGTLALLAGIAQLFSIKVPVLSDPKNALIVIAAIIIIKVVIARLNFLLPK